MTDLSSAMTLQVRDRDKVMEPYTRGTFFLIPLECSVCLPGAQRLAFRPNGLSGLALAARHASGILPA
jgi:hypothetical protein